MGKPLLYAFGGLPIALLGVLLALGHQPPAVEEPVSTETLTPATPLAPEDDAGPVSIPAEVKPPPERMAGASDATVRETFKPPTLPPVVMDNSPPKIPPEILAPPRAKVDGSDETAEFLPVPVAPPRAKVDSNDEMAEAEPVQATSPSVKVEERQVAAVDPPQAEPPVFGNDRTEVAAQDAATAPETKEMGRVIVQPGNTLWRLSRVIYGKGRDYVTIAEANRDIVRDPSLIYPGQVIAIPGATPPEKIDPKRKRPLPPTDGSLDLVR
jgi:nucleoid-associated protein YgaU